MSNSGPPPVPSDDADEPLPLPGPASPAVSSPGPAASPPGPPPLPNSESELPSFAHEHTNADTSTHREVPLLRSTRCTLPMRGSGSRVDRGRAAAHTATLIELASTAQVDAQAATEDAKAVAKVAGEH